MDTAPFARLAVTMTGSISGVSPTATAMAKMKDSCQLPLVNPLMTKTAGTMTPMKRIRSQDTFLMPLSKLVSLRCPKILFASEPKKVESPVVTTTAVAEPLTTFEPRKQRFLRSKAEALLLASSELVKSLLSFSTGRASPVRADWLI